MSYTLLYLLGYWGTGGRGTHIARHHGVAGGAGFACIEVDNLLGYLKTLVAPVCDLRCYSDTVVVMYLRVEIDVEMHYHNAEISLFWSHRYAGVGKIMGFAKVEELHDYSIVDMTHHVDIIKTDLQW